LIEALRARSATAQDLLARVDGALGAFVADAEQFDDVAMLAARRMA
jgi:hypothetical protein